MDKIQMTKLLSHPALTNEEEMHQIVEACEQYPFSAPLQVLAACAQKAWEPEKVDEARVARVAIAVVDSHVFELLLSRAAKRSDEPYDVLREINDFQEISFKTAPKEVILNSFLKAGDCDVEDSEPDGNASTAELAKKSVEIDESLCTETLAVVMERQGKYAKAIEVYEKIMARNPEKSSTFAPRIEKLKEKLAFNNQSN